MLRAKTLGNISEEKRDESWRLIAPWTWKQVLALNSHQESGRWHPYTCPGEHDEHRELRATSHGWICLYCDYTQNWVHKAHAGVKD